MTCEWLDTYATASSILSRYLKISRTLFRVYNPAVQNGGYCFSKFIAAQFSVPQDLDKIGLLGVAWRPARIL